MDKQQTTQKESKTVWSQFFEGIIATGKLMFMFVMWASRLMITFFIWLSDIIGKRMNKK